MTPAGACPWDIRIVSCEPLWRGRRLRVRVRLTNRSGVAAIPEPHRLRPTLRDVRNHALATSDLFRPDEAGLIVFRPVIQPDCAAEIGLLFERLPDDRAPALLTFGDACGWSSPIALCSGADLDLVASGVVSPQPTTRLDAAEDLPAKE